MVFADRVLTRTSGDGDLTTFTGTPRQPGGPIAMAVAMVVSIALFSNQQLYLGVLPSAVPAVGDLTFVVGFVLAFALYAALRPVLRRRAAAAA